MILKVYGITGAEEDEMIKDTKGKTDMLKM